VDTVPDLPVPQVPGARRKVSDIAAEQLELKITSGEYPVGSKLASENELAKSFGVGRSSMREAVRTLSAAGYLRSAHGSGVFVVNDRPVNTAVTDRTLSGGYTMTDLLETRESIESTAAQLAAIRLSDHQREVIQSILAAAAPRDLGFDLASVRAVLVQGDRPPWPAEACTSGSLRHRGSCVRRGR
jgi:GntR family transcriptional repressor for pyruvate dehydrogenase complex